MNKKQALLITLIPFWAIQVPNLFFAEKIHWRTWVLAVVVYHIGVGIFVSKISPPSGKRHDS